MYLVILVSLERGYLLSLHVTVTCMYAGLMEMTSKIESKALKGVYLQAELCKVINSIRVREVTKNYTDEFFQLYFENPKKSGGGKVTSIQLLGNGEATVTFQDPRGMLLPYVQLLYLFHLLIVLFVRKCITEHTVLYVYISCYPVA